WATPAIGLGGRGACPRLPCFGIPSTTIKTWRRAMAACARRRGLQLRSARRWLPSPCRCCWRPAASSPPRRPRKWPPRQPPPCRGRSTGASRPAKPSPGPCRSRPPPCSRTFPWASSPARPRRRPPPPEPRRWASAPWNARTASARRTCWAPCSPARSSRRSCRPPSCARSASRRTTSTVGTSSSPRTPGARGPRRGASRCVTAAPPCTRRRKDGPATSPSTRSAPSRCPAGHSTPVGPSRRLTHAPSPSARKASRSGTRTSPIARCPPASAPGRQARSRGWPRSSA
ncbi:MAG: hypothetical protein QOC71_489, partial [Thermoplasmata archaeon]|nr:hypothetical protein [Thermoplasmata archaeon]